jgi:GNAT superfamily N-acetyltransferase
MKEKLLREGFWIHISGKEGRGLPTRLKIQIRDLQENFIADHLAICRNEQLSGIPSYEEGFVRKSRWLGEMLKKTKFLSKIAYIDRAPLGMIQFYPEDCIPFLRVKREDVLRLDCIYVTKELQGKRIGRALLKAMIRDAKESGRFSRVETSTFDAQSGFPQPDFLRDAGFTRILGGSELDLEYSLSRGKIPSQPRTGIAVRNQPERVDGEKGAKLFYEPRCPLSAYFDESIIKAIHEIDTSIKAEEINIWADPEAAIQRGVDQHTVYVNGTPIKEFFLNKEPFKEEVKRILSTSK